MPSFFRVFTEENSAGLSPLERKAVNEILGTYRLIHTKDHYLSTIANKPILQYPSLFPDPQLAVHFGIEENYGRIERMLQGASKYDSLDTRPQLALQFPDHDPILLYATKIDDQYVLWANCSTGLLNAQHDAYVDEKRAARVERRKQFQENITGKIKTYTGLFLPKLA